MWHKGRTNDKIPAPTLEKEEIEAILDSQNKQYEKYMVKWRGRPIEDSSWLSKEEVDHLGFPQPNKMW